MGPDDLFARGSAEYVEVTDKLLRIDGVALSTVMHYPCLRYRGAFIAMPFRQIESLVVKLDAGRVDELIGNGTGMPFNITGKRFKEWVVVPEDHADSYEKLMFEALEFARSKAAW